MATIITKNSQTASAVPSAASLSVGELAVNTADGKLYTEHTGGVVKEIIPSTVVDGGITEAKIASNAVTNTKIANSAVTVAKISATGTPSSTTFLRGDGSWQSAGGGESNNRQVFTSSGTFNVPIGVSRVKVTVIGAGGSGGNGVGDNQGGGGGAGGYVVDYVGVTAGGTASVTVGTNGGTRTSSFVGSTTVSASGGGNGGNSDGSNTGLTGTNGSITLFGQTGYTSSVRITTAGGIQDVVTNSPSDRNTQGGCYAHNFGAGGHVKSSVTTYTNGVGYGAGAGGGGVPNAGFNSTGGVGRDGLVIVEW